MKVDGFGKSQEGQCPLGKGKVSWDETGSVVCDNDEAVVEEFEHSPSGGCER